MEKGAGLEAKERGDAISTRFLARVGLKPIEHFELFGLVGGADLNIDEFDDYDARMELALGGGLRFTVFQSSVPETSHLFLEYAYLQFTTDDQVETIAGTQDDEIFWTEHVARIGGDFRHDIFRPYGGLRISFVRSEDRLSLSGELSLEEDDNVGIFGGIDIFLDPQDKLALNLEASLFDVNSFRAGLRVRF